MTTSTGRCRWTPPSSGSPARCRSTQKGAAHCGEPADHALGRSRGGLSTKVHLAADGRAQPLAFTVTAGQAGDAPAFETVMSRIRVPRTGPGRPRTRPLAVLADRAYSSRAIRSHLRRRDIRAVIPQPSDQVGHPPAARPARRPSARLRQRGLQAAQHRRTVHQPPQAVARPGHTNRQARDRLPGRTPPRGHPHLDPTLTKETEPKGCCTTGSSLVSCRDPVCRELRFVRFPGD
ncbi:transposase [Streptomyces bullii]|uniref:Transposase n=1 Tax=Streptomyces bullii TaxID=349910 RepID=A0ABW0V3P6_9ACTN